MKFSIPETVLERHLAILGINGSGKTSVAKSVIAEPLLEAGQRIAVIDPTGVWWGLRLKADGKHAAFDVAIFGGPHGDLPLNAHSGKTVAEAIGTSATPVVLDTIAMTVRERSQFFTDFAETLLRTNKGPLNLIIDECHLFMPQGGAKSGGMVPDMLNAGNNLVSLGRSKGIRVTMITQRPAKLHKDSLTQALTLIAMQVVHPLDRSAIEDWIKDNADNALSKEIVSSLGGLKPGEGWIWSPRIDLLKRQQFALPKTLDTSSGEDMDAALPAMNLDAIKAKLGKVADDLKANDPRALKAEVARLQTELRKAASLSSTSNEGAKSDRAEVDRAHTDGYRAGWPEGWSAGWTAGRVFGVRAMASGTREYLDAAVKAGEPETPEPPKPPKNIPENIPARPVARAVTQSAPRAPRSIPQGNGADDLTGPQRRIMASLGFWKSIGHDAPSRPQVAAIAGYTHTSGSFRNTISSLNIAGLIHAPDPGRLSLASNANGELLLSTDEARSKLLSILGGPERKIVEALKDSADLSREDVAAKAGYEVTSGSFRNTISTLNVLGVLRKPSPGMVELSDWAREILA